MNLRPIGYPNFKPGSQEYRRMLAPFPDATPAWLDAWAQLHPRELPPTRSASRSQCPQSWHAAA